VNRFRSEIEEQPAALRRLVARYRSGEGRAALERWAGLAARALTFGGMGSSVFAPLAVRPRLAALDLPCAIVEAGEWLHHGYVVGARATVVLISQSGESVEIRRLLEGPLADGAAPIVAITNDEGSALARSANLVLPLQAG